MALGILCKLYRNTSTYASPSWNEVTHIKDFKPVDSKEEFETTTRYGNGIKTFETTLTTIEWSGMMMVPDPAATTGDPNYDDYIVFRNAYYANTQLDILVLDGGVATNGCEGVRALVKVSQWEEDQSNNVRTMKAFKLCVTDPDVTTLAASPTAKPAKRARITGAALTQADFGSNTFA